MGNRLYRLIYPDFIRTVRAATSDEIAAPVESSVISPTDWVIMCEQAGSEELLLQALGVVYEISEQERQIL